MATTTLVLMRRGRIFARRQTWQVQIDGVTAASVGNGDDVTVPIRPGPHTLQVRASQRYASVEKPFDVPDGETVYFICSAPLVWPHALASLLVPSLWIGLRRHLS
jgi:hypothetical protein